MKRAAIIKDGSRFMYCREAIGGEYFNAVASMQERSVATNTKTDVTGWIIVRISDTRWVVSTKTPDDDNIHGIRYECKNLIAAQEMMK